MFDYFRNCSSNANQFCSECLYLNFTGGASPGMAETADCCFVSGSCRKIHVSSPITMFLTRLDHVRRISTAYVYIILPHLSSALQSSCEGPNGRNVSRRRDDHGEFGSHFPTKMPSSSCNSSCVILGSSLISDFALTTFSAVTAVTGRPQRWSSSSVCHAN